MAITLRQLSYFQALVEERHFGRAAKRVHISQPALSIQIRELEKELNAHLVERHTREVIITALGHEVSQRAQQILGQVDDLEYSMRWHGGLSGHLSIGIIPTIAPYLLPGALPVLQKHNPSLEVQVEEAHTEKVLADLVAGVLDVAVIALPSGQVDVLFEQALFEDRFVLAGSVEVLSALQKQTKAVSPDKLDPGQLLLLDEGHCLTDQALEACNLEHSSTLANLRASSLTTLCGLVASGFGLTFLPEISVEREYSASKGMTAIRFGGDQPSRTIGIVRRRLTPDDGWFTDVADIFRKTGEDLLHTARQIIP